MDKQVFTYRINNQDIITSVSENWSSFAQDNDWVSDSANTNVLGHQLWEFIQGIETKHLYHEVFKRIREGICVRPIPFRCDSPRERRFLELLIQPLTDGEIQITSTIIRTEARKAVELLDNQTPRSKQFVKICSMCKKIAVSEDEWVDIEIGLAQLKLFEAPDLPALTHGLCPSCHQEAMADLS